MNYDYPYETAGFWRQPVDPEDDFIEEYGPPGWSSGDAQEVPPEEGYDDES
jgi:hypothetical protein